MSGNLGPKDSIFQYNFQYFSVEMKCYRICGRDEKTESEKYFRYGMKMWGIISKYCIFAVSMCQLLGFSGIILSN